MFAQLIKTSIRSITNMLRATPEIAGYVLMSLGILFLVGAVGRGQAEPDTVVCLSSFASLVLLMAAFAVAVQQLADHDQ